MTADADHNWYESATETTAATTNKTSTARNEGSHALVTDYLQEYMLATGTAATRGLGSSLLVGVEGEAGPCGEAGWGDHLQSLPQQGLGTVHQTEAGQVHPIQHLHTFAR